MVAPLGMPFTTPPSGPLRGVRLQAACPTVAVGCLMRSPKTFRQASLATDLEAPRTFGVALAAGAAVATAAATCGIRPRRGEASAASASRGGRARLQGYKTVRPPPKPRTSKGPKLLKSGYWQEDDEDDDLDIFEWLSAEEVQDEPPTSVQGLREVAAYTEREGVGRSRYDAPEYRAPPLRYQLQKGLKTPPPVDQGRDVTFTDDILETLAEFATDNTVLQDADFITSFDALRMLLAFVDGSMTEDFRAKGLTTRRRSDAEMVDLVRVARLPQQAPKAIALGSVWNWVPSNMTNTNGLFNARSYDVSFQQECTGEAWSGGPPSTRELVGPRYYRILKYELGGLKLVVRTPVVATVPAADAESLGCLGQAVELSTANRRDSGDLWGYDLASKVAQMQLGDIGMIVRGIVDKGTLVDMQELTREDLQLDRPSAVDEAGKLLGRLAGLLRRIREVADCPGCRERPLWLQYADAELRVISPRLDTDEEFTDEDGQASTRSEPALVG